MMPIYVSIIIIVIIVRHKLQEVPSKPEILKTKTDYTSIIVCSTFCYFFIPLSYKWFIPPLSHRRYLLTLTFFIHCGNVLCFTGRVSFMIIYSGNLDHFPDLPPPVAWWARAYKWPLKLMTARWCLFHSSPITIYQDGSDPQKLNRENSRTVNTNSEF